MCRSYKDFISSNGLFSHDVSQIFFWIWLLNDVDPWNMDSELLKSFIRNVLKSNKIWESIKATSFITIFNRKAVKTIEHVSCHASLNE